MAPRAGKQPMRNTKRRVDDSPERPTDEPETMVTAHGVVMTEEERNQQIEALEAAEAVQADKIGAGSSSGGAAKDKPAKKAIKKKKVALGDLEAFLNLSNGKTGSGADHSKKQKRKIEAVIKAFRHMSGDKKGQLSGRLAYAINCAFEDNAAFQALCKRVVHSEPRWIPDFGKWTAVCATAAIAHILHKAVLSDSAMAETAKEVNRELDTSAYDQPGVEQPAFTIATSETQFETAKLGVLPRSRMLMGKRTFEFKEYIKERFPEVRYLDLLFNNRTVTKAAWILPADAETERTGTLADFLRSLGAIVDEVDLDDDEDEDDDAERDEDALIDDEAEEDNGEEDEE